MKSRTQRVDMKRPIFKKSIFRSFVYLAFGALFSVPAIALAVETAPPAYYLFTPWVPSNSPYYREFRLTAQNAAACKQGADMYYATIPGTDNSRVTYGYRFDICYENGVNAFHLVAVCPVTTPPYAFNRVTGLCERPDDLKLQVQTASPTIPTDSRVVKGHVLTKSKLDLTVARGSQPIPGLQLSLQSNRGALDTIKQPVAVTDANGKTVAEINTRNQPGTSVVTSATAQVPTGQPGTITWLPAKYESQFLVTCYAIANEADWPSEPSSKKVCGLPPDKTYSTAFLSAVRRQGTGTALDGTYVHYRDHACYNIDSCARTSSTKCAVVGTTIAVDRHIIPKKSSVNVSILGGRLAQDGGDWIKGYHIDDFMGPQYAACLQIGRRHSEIQLLNY